MATIEFTAFPRATEGRGASRRMRKGGKAPGIVYGGGTAPQPIEMPAPSYPPRALRNGESGTVLLRVHVGADGIPYDVDLVQSSRSRLLDRAASDAVRRWRFRPAMRGGQPVAGEVQVPIAFNATR
jgi:protein TonB